MATVAIELCVPRPIDLAHASCAKSGDDFIRTVVVYLW